MQNTISDFQRYFLSNARIVTEATDVTVVIFTVFNILLLQTLAFIVAYVISITEKTHNKVFKDFNSCT